MGILDPGIRDDFLLPFLSLPALQYVVGFTDVRGLIGAQTVYSEDGNQRAFTVNGTPSFGSTALGVPYIQLNGTTDYLSAAAADWSTLTKSGTLLAVAQQNNITSRHGLVAKATGGGDNNYYLDSAYGSSNPYDACRFEGSDDGSAVAGHIAAVQTLPSINPQLYVGRFTASSQVKIWGASPSTGNSASTSIATLHASADPLYIGQHQTFFFPGKIYLVAFCKAVLDDAHITLLQGHCARWGVHQ